MKKFLFLSAAIFLLAVGCDKIQSQVNNQPQSQTIQQQAATSSADNQAVNPAAGDKPVSQSANQTQAIQPTTTNPSSVAAKVPTISVIQTVDGSSLNKASDDIVVGANAIDLLKQDHQIDTMSYSGLGDMVVGIDGVKADSRHFWEFYVNGESSNLGASSYVLKNGDKIEWKLSAISSSGE